ncbi:hypothetical protein [Bosea sp. (in: a-proteobacteria)]|uniref:hypothetical protein n=1 Tax=Bosea sp. (in: a-proteobacteria) TaxID=1871050 RepID=UPI003B3A5358
MALLPEGDEHGQQRRIALMRGAEPKLVARIEQEAFEIARGVMEVQGMVALLAQRAASSRRA